MRVVRTKRARSALLARRPQPAGAHDTCSASDPLCQPAPPLRLPLPVPSPAPHLVLVGRVVGVGVEQRRVRKAREVRVEEALVAAAGRSWGRKGGAAGERGMRASLQPRAHFHLPEAACPPLILPSQMALIPFDHPPARSPRPSSPPPHPVYDGMDATLAIMSSYISLLGTRLITPLLKRSLCRSAAQKPGQLKMTSMLRITSTSASRKATAGGEGACCG